MGYYSKGKYIDGPAPKELQPSKQDIRRAKRRAKRTDDPSDMSVELRAAYGWKPGSRPVKPTGQRKRP